MLALVLAVGLAGPAGAQDPPATDLVTIEDGFGVAGFVVRDCDGSEETFPGFVEAILRRSGPLVGDAAVGLEYDGPQADNLVEPPTEVVFGDGQDLSFLHLDLVVPRAGGLTITIVPRDGTSVGDPATFDAVVDEAFLGQDCNAPITVPGSADQVIEVGERPEGFFPIEQVGDAGFPCFGFEVAYTDGTGGFGTCVGPDSQEAAAELFAVLETPTVGALPPGLAYADDTWTGAATTPGTYPFQVRLCEDLSAFRAASGIHVVDGRGTEDRVRRAGREALARSLERAEGDDLTCYGTADVEVVVRAASDEAPAGVTGPAPAAAPISTAALFTG
ncbi:hypothetical protein PO878_17990 [Iamia majanohamensis]|uniref:Uncharacterized protein n=1 Tax=Iamia majanohamensis TaxID=467976 RepID=A0AAE9YCN0_9ACTN|nr:hypothetical protein [Iamia majanohamensis]WCO66392.1 hypothetical protein PO878_17990 [Iamia majanohamensis]